VVEDPAEEVDLVEAWLNDMLDEHQGVSYGGKSTGGLSAKGLDRAKLSEAGMDKDAIDRLYRGLYSHSIEFQRLVARETASAQNVGPAMVQGAHDALSHLNASLSQASLGRAPEVEYIDAAALDGEDGAARQYNEEETRMLLESKAEIEIRMQTLMANIAEERRKRQMTERDLEEAEEQILAERGLCDREKIDHGATRLRMEDNQEEAEKVKDWLNNTIDNERMSVAKEKQNVERLNSRIGQLELGTNNLNKAMERATGEVNMAKGEIEQLRIVEAKLEKTVDGKDKDIMILKSNFQADLVECARQKDVYDDIVAQMQAAKKMYDEETTTNAKLQAVIDAHVGVIENLETTRDHLESTKAQNTEEMAALEADVTAKAALIVDLEEKAELLVLTQSQLESSQEIRSKLATELESTRENSKAMEGDLQGKLFKTKSFLETMTSERDVLDAAADKAKREWQKAEEREDALEDDVEGQKVVKKKAVDRRDVAIDGMARAQVAVEDLERQLKNIKAERDKLVEINRNLDEDLRTAKDKAKNKEQQFKDTDRMLKATMETTKSDSAAAEAKIKKLDGDLALERKRVQDLLPEVEKYKALKKDNAALDAEHKKIVKERDALDIRLQQAEKERIKAANDRAAAVKEKAETNAKLKIANGDIERLTKAKKTLEERVASLEQRLIQTEEELAETKANLKMSTAECSRLEANLKQEEEEHAECRAKLEAVEAQVLEIAAKNEELVQKEAALEEELVHYTNANISKAQMIQSSMEAFKRERDEAREMNANLKQQLENLWGEIDKEMRDKSEIAEKMMRIQEEFQLAANMLDKESEAHSMTAKNQAEAEAKLKAEIDVAEAAAAEAKRKRDEEAAAAAKKHNQTQSVLKMSRAAEKERRRRDAEAAQKELDEMSAEAQRKMIDEQLRMISGLEQELGKAGEEALKAEEVSDRLANVHQKMKEREAEMLAFRGTIEGLELQAKVDKSAWDAEKGLLEDKIQSEATARRVRERYAEDLSKKLKMAKLEIIKLGRKPKTYSKEVQTTYAELWVRNFLDEDDVAERRSGWVPKAVVTRQKKGASAGPVSGAGAAATRNTIVTILSEKVKADMAAVRESKVPMQLPQFTYSYFYTRYGLPEATEERLLEFAEAVHRHRGVPDVARFGLSCGLLGEDDDDTWQQRHGVVVQAGGASAAAGALAGFPTGAGAGATAVAGGRVTTRSVGPGDADGLGGGGGSPSTLRASVPTVGLCRLNQVYP
jgi:hypothetical protein